MTHRLKILTAPVLAAAVICDTTTPSAAHPHIFIDAGLRLIFEQNVIVAVEVTWTYDELYTLILLEDYNLDPDFDFVLTEAEVAETLGFDLNWNSGFEGGLRLSRGGQDLHIGAPEAVSMTLQEPGQMVTTHRRPVVDTGTGAIVAQVYDDAFYVAFEMIGDMGAEGAACTDLLERADLDTAYAALDEAINAIGGAVAAEDNFPALGALFADRVIFDCTP